MKRKCTLNKMRINAQGYNSMGHYYGVGDPVYWCLSDCGSIDMVLRAKDRKHAKEQIRANLIPVGSNDKISFYN